MFAPWRNRKSATVATRPLRSGQSISSMAVLSLSVIRTFLYNGCGSRVYRQKKGLASLRLTGLQARPQDLNEPGEDERL